MKKNGRIKTELAKKVLKCTICSKSGFTSTYKLKSHMFLHKAVPARHKCTFCPKEYYRSDEYSRHIAAHMKAQKQYFCDHCGRGFVDKRNLILHLNVHDDLPRYPDHRYRCLVCGAHYCEERLLKHHIRKEHSNINPSEPIYVTKKINETWIEKVHNRNSYVEITRVKPSMLLMKKTEIKCKEEKKRVDDQHAFQQYIASVLTMKTNCYSKVICDYCGKEMLKKSIIPHIRERHLKLRRFNCEVCNRTFKRHYQLCMHTCGQRDRRRRKVKLENSTKNT